MGHCTNRAGLMTVSEVEQEVACKDDMSAQYRAICGLIENPAVGAVDALRVVMLFALRYESNRAKVTARTAVARTRAVRDAPDFGASQIMELKDLLQRSKGVSPSELQLVDAVLAYGGMASRSCDLFSTSLTARLSTSMRRVRPSRAPPPPLLTSPLC